MKKLLLLVCLLAAGSHLLQAQNSFVNNCVGNWHGMMYIYKNGIVKDSIQVRLTVEIIKEGNAWKWKTEYLSGKMPITKDYILRLKDAAKNWYETDEGGGVVLQEYLFDNKLYGVFETGGFMLTSTYELKENQLIFEVTAGKKITNPNIAIINYSVDNLQRVIFKKIP